MAHAEKCPICDGSGKKSNPKNMDDTYTKCHGCDGKGWIEVGSEPVVLPTPAYHPVPVGHGL